MVDVFLVTNSVFYGAIVASHYVHLYLILHLQASIHSTLKIKTASQS
jgi:hypothetical protein